MKRLLIFGAIFVAGVALVSFAALQIGEVNIRWQAWEINTSVTFFAVVLLLAFVVFYFVLRVFAWLFNLPNQIRKYRELKRYKKAQQSLSVGLLAQEQDNWALAEKQLIKTAKLSENGVMQYLTAARMAHLQQATARRDKYLAQAVDAYPEQAHIVGLVQAKLLETAEPEKARDILQQLQSQNPRNRAILLAYVQILREQQDLANLKQMLPFIRKHAGWNSAQFNQLSEEIICIELRKSQTGDSLNKLWQSLSGSEQKSQSILASYVETALKFEQFEGLSGLLEKSIARNFDEQLVYLYGKINFGPAYDRLKKAQTWQQGKYADNPVLLMTLGRLACQGQVWGQAKDYLTESLKLQPEIETFLVLAQCYEAQGEDREAALVYKQAMLEQA